VPGAQIIASDTIFTGDRMTFPSHTVPSPQRDWLTVPQAAIVAEVSERTIRAWCLDHRIGIMVGGRWRVFKASLTLFLAGNHQRLTASGDER
jgi:hypothetical protein